MRRISWIDQRIRNAWSEDAAAFFERHGIGVMTDDGHHGEGEHGERDMAMPAMPGAGFVVIETEFVLGGFEAVFDGPAMTFHRDQLFHGRALGAPGGEESELAVGDAAADHGSPCPLALEGAVVFAGMDRPVRDKPSRTGAVLWFLRRTTSAARRSWEGLAQSSPRCPEQIASCPKS